MLAGVVKSSRFFVQNQDKHFVVNENRLFLFTHLPGIFFQKLPILQQKDCSKVNLHCVL